MQLRDLSPVLAAPVHDAISQARGDNAGGDSRLVVASVPDGADVQLVPHQSEQAPAEGVGALLRYTDDSTATS